MSDKRNDKCFSCQDRKNPGECIVSRFQLEDVKVGERVTVHTSLPGIGPWSVTGMLAKEYRRGDPKVEIETSTSWTSLVADF